MQWSIVSQNLFLCVCVCVCERERERGCELYFFSLSYAGISFFSFYTSISSVLCKLHSIHTSAAVFTCFCSNFQLTQILSYIMRSGMHSLRDSGSACTVEPRLSVS
jgi:hypothetical protein